MNLINISLNISFSENNQSTTRSPNSYKDNITSVTIGTYTPNTDTYDFKQVGTDCKMDEKCALTHLTAILDALVYTNSSPLQWSIVGWDWKDSVIPFLWQKLYKYRLATLDSVWKPISSVNTYLKNNNNINIIDLSKIWKCNSFSQETPHNTLREVWDILFENETVPEEYKSYLDIYKTLKIGHLLLH